jgi:biopolymer transport protein ExbB/TolQ
MSSHSQPTGRRLGSTLAVLLVGLPMAALALALFHYGPLRNTHAFRYVEYPVQWVEVAFFSCGVAALLLKLLQIRLESTACALDILPRWDGKPVPVDRASDLVASLERQPAGVQDTFLGRRIRAILDFLKQRKGAKDLDDQLRSLSETDNLAQENSFALVRFITWAIPILGFLGTVIGITGAIGGVTPEELEETLSTVTGGLAEAFDSTALALSLTMVLMFLSYLVERQEQGILLSVDRLVDQQLGHRFQREGADSAPIIEIVKQQTQSLVQSVEGLVIKQAELWAAAMQEPERRAASAYQQVQQQLTNALGQALDQTIEAYAQRLAALEQQSLQQSLQLLQQLAAVAAAVRDTGREQQESLLRVAEGISAQAETLSKLQEDSANVVHLQAVLHQNLAALASTSSFEEAVHSLTGAVHLLTARVSGGTTLRISQGKAA